MDTELSNLIDTTALTGKKFEKPAEVKFIDLTTGTLEIERPDGEPVKHTLKPLKELYAPGTDAPSVDPQDDRYMPLFLAIESEIAQYYEEVPTLTDGAVGLVLDQLALSPEAPTSDPLARQIQMVL